MAGALQKTGFALLGLLLLVLTAAGQIKLGDLTTDMNGTLSAGYNGTYGNQIGSDHSLAVGGAGTLSGSYYNPNFLSFMVSPYLNQARDNSAYQSISNSSGVSFTSSIFGGSHFPGSINYAKAYDSEGNFAIPGVANYTTHGNSDTLGVSWAEMVPGLPSLSASFQTGSNQYSIYGSNDTGSSDNHSFNLRSGYLLRGFNMSAYFGDGSGHSDIPQVLQGSAGSETATSSNRSYGFSVGHALPFHGGVAGNFNSSEYDSEFEGNSSSGTVDTYNATASFQPTNKLYVSFSTDYSTNLAGSLYQAVAGTGGVVQAPDLGQASHSMDVLANASYALLPNMQALAFADHREQYFLGESFSANSYGGGMTYGRPLFGGNLNAAVSASDNTISTSSENSLGLNSSVNYNKRFDGWAMGVTFGYTQNVQTLLVTYMSSSYNYGGNLRRRFGKFGWSGGAVVNKTLLTEVAGSSNSSESFNSSISYSHWMTANANYSKSNGSAIEAGAGLAPNPVPQPIVPFDDLILYGGKSYSFGLSSSPMRRMTIGASFAKANTNTDLAGTTSTNDTKLINILCQYQFRKMYLTGGYSNLLQGFSASGLPPENVSSFYVGVTRWFNFF